LVYAWACFYNYARVHLSFSEPPRSIPGSTELERLKALITRGDQVASTDSELLKSIRPCIE
ncbi:MAG: hypothetical protein DRJ63_09800, partial [Thermoprotei archaeon]